MDGYRHYCLMRCNASKMDEVRKNVMQEMRELARLFLEVRCVLDVNVEHHVRQRRNESQTRPWQIIIQFKYYASKVIVMHSRKHHG